MMQAIVVLSALVLLELFAVLLLVAVVRMLVQELRDHDPLEPVQIGERDWNGDDAS